MRILLTILMFAFCFESITQNKKSDKLVKIKTSFGDMVAVLYDETPLHKANFLKHAEAGNYDSTIFHRVINEFMIQGGNIYSSGKINKPEEDILIPAEILDGFFS